MKVKVVTLTTELQNKGLLKLKYSLDHYGWDYHIIHQDAQSGGHIFGTQMPLVYEYLKELRHSNNEKSIIFSLEASCADSEKYDKVELHVDN